MNPDQPDIRPAFPSFAGLAGFAGLLLILLICPLLLRGKLLPPRASLYATVPWGLGGFPYLHQQIFEETNDIDIAFMGPSPIWWGINTPYVQAALSRALNRPAVVRSLCWNWCGFDPLYFIGQDLLAHHKVHMIVFCDLSKGANDSAHNEAMHWFRFAENSPDLAGLDWRSKGSFYAAAILGVPRNLLSLARPDLPVIPTDTISWGDFKGVPNPAESLGSLAQNCSTFEQFEKFKPATNPDPLQTCISPPESAANFLFSSQPLYPTQREFAQKVAALAAEHGVKLVYLHMPEIYEAGSAKIPENADWPKLFGDNLTMVAMPGADLFAHLTPGEVTNLFWDFQHLNENGQLYFTRAITPSLVRLYETQNHLATSH